MCDKSNFQNLFIYEKVTETYFCVMCRKKHNNKCVSELISKYVSYYKCEHNIFWHLNVFSSNMQVTGRCVWTNRET
jgi:methyltransferase-like protein